MPCDPSSPATKDAYAPVELVEGRPGGRLLLVCDHASNRVPPELGDLGLPAAEFTRHIAYDIGMRGVTLKLAEMLGAPAVLSTTSRLVIDPNRGEDDPTLVMRLSDGAIVPGNARVDALEVRRRIERYHRPYHDAITAQLDAIVDAGDTPVIVAMHSFTPAWKGHPRPWHVGFLWDVDDRLTRPLVSAFASDGDLIVGDNEPYDGALAGDTMHSHGTRRGFPHTLVEIRQDLVADEVGQQAWAERFAKALPQALALPEMARITHFGSRTDVRRRTS